MSSIKILGSVISIMHMMIIAMVVIPSLLSLASCVLLLLLGVRDIRMAGVDDNILVISVNKLKDLKQN